MCCGISRTAGPAGVTPVVFAAAAVAGPNSTSSRSFVRTLGALVGTGGTAELTALWFARASLSIGTLYVRCAVAHPTANITFTLMKNGAATALTGVLNATLNTVTITGGPITYAIGDSYNLRCQASVAEANADWNCTVQAF